MRSRLWSGFIKHHFSTKRSESSDVLKSLKTYRQGLAKLKPETEVRVISTQGESSKSIAPAPVLDGVRVLLVDDSPDNQRLFERVLVSVGAYVDVAENGVVAIARSQVTNYDVIIMDIRMPMMDGYEATRRIRAQGYTGPVLALTAHANPGEEERCRTAGCSGFYLKPINRASLISAVTDALSR